MKVAVVGIGRVGLPLAAVSSKYHETIGIDIDSETVYNVNENRKFGEPSLNEYLERYGLKACTDFSKIADSNLVFLCVGSQSAGEGYSAKILLSTLDRIIPYLKRDDQVVNVVTTLPLGDIENQVLPYMERRGTMNHIKGVCYNPAMIALGNAINDFEHPNYILIGESNASAGDTIETYWRKIVDEKVPFFRSSFANIALAKYALNIALVLKISLMNVVTELCERAGGDVDILSQILRAEPRIAGPRMFRGGLGYGGTCFPVDVEALKAECRRLALPTTLAEAIEDTNTRQVERSAELIRSLGKRRIAVLGITYKPDTSIVVASQAIQLAEILAREGYDVMIYDPRGLEEARDYLGELVAYADNVKQTLSFADVIFLGVEWQEFKELDRTDFRPDQIVVDPWRILRDKSLACSYIAYGLKRE